MRLTGYLIEKYNSMGNAYTCRRLVEEAEKLDMNLRIVGVHDTLVCKDGVFNAGEKLERRDFAINRYKWGHLKEELNGLSRRSYNPLEAYNRYINKYEQVKRLRSGAFEIPDYILGTSLNDFETICSKLGLPFVAKGLESSMGQEIVLIESEDDFRSLSGKYSPEKEWLFEAFIEESRGRDMRIYSIRGAAAAGMIRSSSTDFRANVALGADVKKMELTEDIQRIAADIYEQTGLDFLGIDLLFGREKPYLCEINVMPGIEGIERASGQNIAGKIMETVRGDFCG